MGLGYKRAERSWGGGGRSGERGSTARAFHWPPLMDRGRGKSKRDSPRASLITSAARHLNGAEYSGGKGWGGSERRARNGRGPLKSGRVTGKRSRARSDNKQKQTDAEDGVPGEDDKA